MFLASDTSLSLHLDRAKLATWSVIESSEPVVVDAVVVQSVVTVTAEDDITQPVIQPVTISSFYSSNPKCMYDVRTSLASRSRPSLSLDRKTAAT